MSSILGYLTFSEYPFATIMHWAQGIVVGVLFARSLFHRTLPPALFGLAVTIAFLTYEVSEYLNVKDEPYIDIANFLAMKYLAFAHACGIHYGWRWWTERRRKKSCNGYDGN